MRIVTPIKLVAFAVLALVAAATVWGLIALWPDSDRVARAADRAPLVAEGTTFETGELLAVTEGCAEAAGSTADECLTFSIGIRSGDDAGHVVDITARGAITQAGLQAGDRIELMASPHAPTAETRYRLANQYSVSGVFRGLPLAILALVFVAVVIAVGRLRGLLALLALGISATVLLAFLLPALVAGSPGLLVGVIASSAIMFVILYLVHGFNMRTTSALVGTLCGIAIMAGVSLIATQATRLSGIGDEASGTLAGVAEHMDFRGLLSCSVIIAGLGILNDVTITQASSVWELRAAAPAMPRHEVYASAMRIGRDHIASTVYTVFFAYVGAALGVLILVYLYNRPLLSLLTHEDIAIEAVRTLCGSIGLVLAVPIATRAAVCFAPAPSTGSADAASPAEAPSV
ncbi:YibE/F family protein [Leucobacter chironomi]|uniref:YibE/F family protein n=1 Tax=Leucobacter chironomi TaxID=491918 RepID=UPI000405ADE9|nr:YibE/F family protein [Leucobacter chironomi]